MEIGGGKTEEWKHRQTEGAREGARERGSK